MRCNEVQGVSVPSMDISELASQCQAAFSASMQTPAAIAMSAEITRYL
jgi:hypothetical protein